MPLNPTHWTFSNWLDKHDVVDMWRCPSPRPSTKYFLLTRSTEVFLLAGGCTFKPVCWFFPLTVIKDGQHVTNSSHLTKLNQNIPGTGCAISCWWHNWREGLSSSACRWSRYRGPAHTALYCSQAPGVDGDVLASPLRSSHVIHLYTVNAFFIFYTYISHKILHNMLTVLEARF